MIRYATSEDIPAIRDLWQIVFHDTTAFLDAYIEYVFRPENTIVSIENNMLCASMQLLPYTYNVKGKTVDAVYIFSVMTHPDKRKQGHMKRMFDFAEKQLRCKNTTFAFLVPQSNDLFALYQKMGFCPAFQQAVIEMDLPSPQGELIVPNDDKWVRFFIRYYRHDTVIPSTQWLLLYKRVLALEGGAIWAVENENELSALCFVLPSSQGLRVLDMLCIDDKAENELLGGLSKIYGIDKAQVSGKKSVSNSPLGMIKIFNHTLLTENDFQHSYLSLMMNEG